MAVNYGAPTLVSWSEIIRGVPEADGHLALGKKWPCGLCGNDFLEVVSRARVDEPPSNLGGPSKLPTEINAH